MVNREHLKQLSKWAGFVGIMNIIFGTLSAIGGLFAFIIGAIPGIITIVLGVKLRNAKKYADEILASDQDDGKINMVITSLNSYFMIQGILLIIVTVLSLLGILAGGLLASYFSFYQAF